jgi:divalent metal cation (Fe/Co/Zn/Cd) transporter
MNEKKLYKYAFGLALFTIVYNVLEAFFALYFGAEDESLSLFGFGIDSLIEVISGLGIAHMVIRIPRNPDSSRDAFERTALRITGVSFYLFTIGLIVSAVITFVGGHKPETTFWGIVISLISIAFMWALIWGKTYVGKRLNSEAILADAACSRTCVYMSLVLLASSGIYALTHWPFVDGVGALGLAVFSFMEGKECFEKARSNQHCGCSCSCKD